MKRTHGKRRRAAKHHQRQAERRRKVTVGQRQVWFVNLHRASGGCQLGGARPRRCGMHALSISTSQTWLKPTMQTFISSAGTMACTTPASVCAVTSDGLLTAMRDTETILS